MNIRPHREIGPLAELGLPSLLLLHARLTGAVGHVDHNRLLGPEVKGRGHGPGKAHLLLHRRHRGHLGLDPPGCQVPQRLEHHKGPDAVIDGPRDQPPPIEVARGLIDHSHRAHLEALEGRLTTVGTDVDPEVLEANRFFPVFLFLQMDRLFPDHAEDLPRPAEKAHPLAHEHLGIPAAEPCQVDEAVLIDVGHDHPDLIDMPGEHQPGAATRVELGVGIASGITPHPIGEALGFGAPNLGRRLLKATWTHRLQKRFQKTSIEFDLHRQPPRTPRPRRGGHSTPRPVYPCPGPEGRGFAADIS